MSARSAEIVLAAAAEEADTLVCLQALRAGSKTFHAASLLLPSRMRAPAAAIYAFCREADDAVDEEPRDPHALAALGRRLDRVFGGRPGASPVDRALAVAVREHDLPREPFDAMLEGFAWDERARTYETIEDVRAYGARVAATVGAMMTALVGPRHPDVLARACDLGVAMQLTNIARDVGEDARRGRVYLPRAWLDEAEIDAAELAEHPAFRPRLGFVVQRLVAEAEVLYERATPGLAMLPRDSRVALRAAGLLYRGIHAEIARAGFDTVSRRAFVPVRRKIVLAARALGSLFWRDLEPGSSGAAARGGSLPPLAETRFLVDAVARG
jgi:phytoene synthase